jgi:hypothetical protein
MLGQTYKMKQPPEHEFQLQLNSNRGQSSVRFRRLQAEDYLDGCADIDPSYLCRSVNGECRGDYAAHYYKFSQLSHSRVRTRFIQEDVSLHLASIPSQMQEKHLVDVAAYMGVCIHIL